MYHIFGCSPGVSYHHSHMRPSWNLRARFRVLRGATKYIQAALKARSKIFQRAPWRLPRVDREAKDANNAVLLHCVQAEKWTLTTSWHPQGQTHGPFLGFGAPRFCTCRLVCGDTNSPSASVANLFAYCQGLSRSPTLACACPLHQCFGRQCQRSLLPC